MTTKKIFKLPPFAVKPQQTATPFKKVSTAPPISSGPIKPRVPIVHPKSAPDVLKTSKEDPTDSHVSVLVFTYQEQIIVYAFKTIKPQY